MKAIYIKHLKTTGLMWAGCLVLFLLANILVLAPQRRNRKNIEKQLTDKKQIHSSALAAAQKKSKIRLSEQIEDLQDRLTDFVSGSDDSANLIFDISQIANEKKVDSFSIKARNKPGGSEIPNCEHICENHIDISFTSGFEQFATFLNALERYRPVVFVDKFTITRAEHDSSGHRVRMDLAVFVKKQQDG